MQFRKPGLAILGYIQFTIMGAPEKPKVRDENTVKFVRGQRQDFLRLKQHMDKVLFTRPDDTFACPRCAETIKRAAKVCRYCGAELTA